MNVVGPSSQAASWHYFLTVTTAPNVAARAIAWARTTIRDLSGSTGLSALHLYTPMSSSDPYLDDGPGPALLLEFVFDNADVLKAFAISQKFRAAVATCDAGWSLTYDGFGSNYYPVAGAASPEPRSAAVSYVVRYYEPVCDAAAFNAYYVAHHPPILGRLPNVRNVICYLPFSVASVDGVVASGCFLGNEVVFDSLAELNTALASDVRDELREDFHRFPAFTGANTHFAMERTELT